MGFIRLGGWGIMNALIILTAIPIPSPPPFIPEGNENSWGSRFRRASQRTRGRKHHSMKARSRRRKAAR
jgi:hypothetical protein